MMMSSPVAMTGVQLPQPGRDLARACREFEGIFLSELLKPLDSALGGEGSQGVLAPLARQTVSEQLAGSLGIGKLLYQQLAQGTRA